MKLVLIALAFASLLTLISAAGSGRFDIDNSTPYDFKLVKQYSIQMDIWNWPKIIASRRWQTFPVQFSPAGPTNLSRVAVGYAIYELNNIGSFVVNALHTGVPDLWNINVIFMNFSNLGTDILIGLWNKTGNEDYFLFQISGKLGDFEFKTHGSTS